VVLAGLLAFYAWRLAWQSHQYHDISTSADATPLWIPQILMGVGTTVLLVALVDEWVLELLRKRSHESVETRHE
jgi:ABC-type spermidine/putrescine transport system permease subunit II